jgi:tripartite-type tricarboxylate transporter receptor subunit TctC
MRQSFNASIVVFTAVLAAVLPTGALAQDFPSKPVRLIVGAAAGSSGDVLARIIGDELSKVWKQSVVVDNRPGAGGILANQALLSAAPDGHTLMASAGSYLTITPFTQKSLPYDVEKDFAPIAMAGEVPLVFGVSPNVPVANLTELIEYARKNPGKVEFAANTPSTLPHLASMYFLHSAQADMTYVPYKGSAAALQDVMGGRLGMVIEGVSALSGAFKSGALRPFAVSSAQRLSILPNVPAVAEHLPGYSAVGFFVFIAQAKIPDAIVRKVNADVNRIVVAPDVAERLAATGNFPRVMSPAEVGNYLREQRAIWGPVVKSLGLTGQ